MDTQNLPQEATSITVEDTSHVEPPTFCPLRAPGQHLGGLEDDDEAKELDIFSYFFTEELIDRLVLCTNLYADAKKDSKPTLYAKFKRHPLIQEEMMRYIGCLLILSISHARNYRHLWDRKSTQYLLSINTLMSRNRFEEISAFLHVVNPAEEEANITHPLKKILQLQDYIKQKCFDGYQPLQQGVVSLRRGKIAACAMRKL
jgi:hypothetical protein